ncbi:MAG: putative small protein [Actinomycetota bacterium]|jgi:hypothetical protein|nr:putative small protein [Actinomycetota bacterium]
MEEGPRNRELPVDVIQFAALDDERRKLLLSVHDLMDEISYGTVVIVLQDGRVIQIETSEKIRLR